MGQGKIAAHSDYSTFHLGLYAGKAPARTMDQRGITVKKEKERKVKKNIRLCGFYSSRVYRQITTRRAT